MAKDNREDRFFKNTHGFYQQQDLIDESFLGEVKTFLCSKLELLYEKLTLGHIDPRDTSVYTGVTGVALCFDRLKGYVIHKDSLVKDTLTNALRSTRTHKGLSFLEGSAGCLAFSAVFFKDSNPTLHNECVHQLLALGSELESCKTPDEMLYGRAGYLYALLLVRNYSGKDAVSDELIAKVVSMILDNGVSQRGLNKHPLVLLYTWHNKHYMGAAHGYIGILYMLLQSKLLVAGSVSDAQLQVIATCLDQLLTLRYPTSNIPSSIGSERDQLVHWCHGATGAVFLYTLAYKVFEESKYLIAAHEFADVVWNRGILKRGYGLCHGVSGNGYAFLCLYQQTKKKEYLWKAVKFGEWCLKYGEHGCRIPDRPFSLFEGLAGTLCFLGDVVNPEKATFPAFQLFPC